MTSNLGGRELLGGRYEILEEIGRGGMGIVYKAMQRSLGKLVAVKALPTQIAATEEAIRRFEREARALAQLNHPNIVVVYDLERENSDLFLIMEYVNGRSLSNLLAVQGAFSSVDAARVGAQVASALAAAHASGIVHRDIKPANILVETATRRVKIIDFGIAVMAGAASLTSAGMQIGTPKYMSPEQVQAQGVTGASDIYSLGVVLYEMIAGHAPFSGDNAMVIAYQHVHQSPPPLARVAPGVHPVLRCAIERAMEKDPARRFPSASEVEEILQEVARSEPQRAAPSARQRERSWIPRIAVIAGACIAAAALTIGLSEIVGRRSGPVKVEITQRLTVEEREDGGDVAAPAEAARPGADRGAGPVAEEARPARAEIATEQAQESAPRTPEEARRPFRESPGGGLGGGPQAGDDAESREVLGSEAAGSEDGPAEDGGAASALDRSLSVEDQAALTKLLSRWSDRVSSRVLAGSGSDLAPSVRLEVKETYTPIFRRCKSLRCEVSNVSMEPLPEGSRPRARVCFQEKLLCVGSYGQTTEMAYRVCLEMARSGKAWTAEAFTREEAESEGLR